MKKINTLTSILLLSSLATTNVFADTATSTIAVSATVPSDCIVSTTPLQFNEFSPAGTQNGIGQGEVSVTCNAGSNYTIGLGDGLNYNAGNRRMANSTDVNSFLIYGLYQDPSFTQQWDTINTLGAIGTGSAQNFTVYAKISTGQNTATTGDYADTVDVTVTY